MLEGEDSADDDGSKGAELFKKFYRGKKPQKDDSDVYGSEMKASILLPWSRIRGTSF